MLITRPVAQNTPLIELLKAKGIEPIILPTLEIEAVPNLEGDRLCKLEKKSLVILITQNAVWSLSQAWIESLIKQEAVLFTMGQATTQAAEQRGLSVFYTPPAGATSEVLVDRILDYQEVKGCAVLMLSAQGGRDFLASSLKQKGARVEEISVYSRHCPHYSDNELERIFRGRLAQARGATEQDCILVTSNQGLENLLSIIRSFSSFDLELALNLKAWKVIVPSERVRQYALSQGFERVNVSRSAQDKDMIEAALY